MNCKCHLHPSCPVHSNPKMEKEELGKDNRMDTNNFLKQLIVSLLNNQGEHAEKHNDKKPNHVDQHNHLMESSSFKHNDKKHMESSSSKHNHCKKCMESSSSKHDDKKHMESSSSKHNHCKKCMESSSSKHNDWKKCMESSSFKHNDKKHMESSSSKHNRCKKCMESSSSKHDDWKKRMESSSSKHDRCKKCMESSSSKHDDWKKRMESSSSKHDDWKKRMESSSSDHNIWKNWFEYSSSSKHNHWKKRMESSSSKHNDMKRFTQHLVEVEMKEKQPDKKCPHCNPSKCEDFEKLPEKSLKQHVRKLSLWEDESSSSMKSPIKRKCQHCKKGIFTESVEMESEFHPMPHKKHHNHKESPKNIWLPEILSLLYKQGLLDLDGLFSEMENHNVMESSSNQDCHHKTCDYHDKEIKKDPFHNSNDKNHCSCKMHHKTKYFYGNLPLKSYRKKPFNNGHHSN